MRHLYLYEILCPQYVFLICLVTALPAPPSNIETIKTLTELKTLETESRWVFPNSASASGHLQDPKKAWKRLTDKSGLKDLRLHDLRRTHGTYQNIMGVNQFTIYFQIHSFQNLFYYRIIFLV
ncbi:MAG: hypothetical protein LBR35_00220 [Rickettsiales bacterium]|jgi:integrase|nr:hypothetical protein [Rickettsiales bacterium]